MSPARIWLMAARPRTLPAAIAPVLVGTAAAVEVSGDIRWGAFIAALVGSIFIQIGTNLANDYSDARRGADTADRLGPVRVTSSGLVAPRRVLVATWLAFAVAVAAGIYLATVAGWIIIAGGAFVTLVVTLAANDGPWWAALGFAAAPLALRPARAVMTRTDGPALNGALAGSGALLGVFSLLASAGLVIAA